MARVYEDNMRTDHATEINNAERHFLDSQQGINLYI